MRRTQHKALLFFFFLPLFFNASVCVCDALKNKRCQEPLRLPLRHVKLTRTMGLEDIALHHSFVHPVPAAAAAA